MNIDTTDLKNQTTEALIAIKVEVEKELTNRLRKLADSVGMKLPTERKKRTTV